MCGRYVCPDDAALERFFAIDRRSPNPFARRYNVAPTTMVPVIFRSPDGAAELREARWGLVPHWWKDTKLPGFGFNARSEDAATKPMWRNSFGRFRCLVPAEGWYEWKGVEIVDATTGEIRRVKQPIHLRHPVEPVIAFAGLLAFWTRPDGTMLTSCAVMTKAAAPGIANVHDRMPVVLRMEDFAAWIDPAQGQDAARRMVADAQETFVTWPVGALVNNARNDVPSLIEPVAPLSDDPGDGDTSLR